VQGNRVEGQPVDVQKAKADAMVRMLADLVYDII